MTQFEATAAFLDAHSWTSRAVEGVWLRWPSELNDDVRPELAAEAVRLLCRYDPRRFRRVRRFAPVIRVTAYEISYWDNDTGRLWLSPSRTRLDTAASLVHDVTHALLDSTLTHPPVFETGSETPLRRHAHFHMRSEELCLREEQRFVSRLAELEIEWSLDEREVLLRHRPWIEEVVAFRRSFLADVIDWVPEPAGPRPEERPEPLPPWRSPTHRRHQNWKAAVRRRFLASAARHAELERWERELRDGPTRLVLGAGQALSETHNAFSRVGHLLATEHKRRARGLRYWNDPWSAGLLEDAMDAPAAHVDP